jgi:hypothetical protein
LIVTDSEQDCAIHGSWWGEHPVAGGWFYRQVHGMNANQFSPDANQKTAQAQKPAASAESIQGKPVAAYPKR